MRITVAAAVTGKNLHDSQVSVLREELAEQNVTHLYSLMDAVYDVSQIYSCIERKACVFLLSVTKS